MKIIKTAQYESSGAVPSASPVPPPENLVDNSQLISKINRLADNIGMIAKECETIENGPAHANQLMNAMNIVRTVSEEIGKIPSGFVDPHLIENPNHVV